ncbi:MAG TPA: MotA/TolQ/ExbB proton channel family protein [bacterium]|nr:MotA/TolQ/ExbB proton channel family protein [bacterium]
MDNILFSSIRETGIMGKSILLFLIAISVYVWAVIGIKLKTLLAAQRATKTVMKLYRAQSSNLSSLFNDGRFKNSPSPIAAIFMAGCKELLYHLDEQNNSNGGKLTIIQLDGIENTLKRTISDQIMTLERSLIVLATASSASPFIGLFGTVWGIMAAFRTIGIQGAGSIDAVAPGIAEALVTTAAGLAVAIPSMVAYNWLVDRVKALTAEMDNFASEFISLIEKKYMQN